MGSEYVVPDEHLLFTSECTTEGHPDKLCDIVSDSIVDSCLAQDPNAKVACETIMKPNLVIVLGEVTTTATVDYEQTVRETIRDLGCLSEECGINANYCTVLVHVEEQSRDLIHQKEELVAGDQGQMVGYATDETPEAMPFSGLTAAKMARKLTELRRGPLDCLRPAGKCTITVEYKQDNGRVVPVRVHSIVIALQHDPAVALSELKEQLRESLVKETIPAQYLDVHTKFTVKHLERCTGLTGHKIVSDTYGGWGGHGGGALSGKDPSKLDRSAAYAARWVAKSLVKAGLCARCLIQLAYSVGVASPVSVFVDTYGTSKGNLSEKDLALLVLRNFDLRAGSVVSALNLQRPLYKRTAVLGHFGREEEECGWESPKDLSHEL